MQCDRCGKEAVTLIRYSGAHLCKRHFIEFFESRVKKEFKRQVDLPKEATLAIAVSGGKDSVVAMHMVWDILKEHRRVRLEAITVDEGIEGYRPGSIGIARKAAGKRGMAHHVVSFKEAFGVTMDEIGKLDIEQTPCAYCGVLRRQCLNMKAKELGADYLITGLNLDDTAQSILMNFVRGDVEKLARLGPHSKVQPGLVPRLQPLRMIPEKESYLFAVLAGIGVHDQVCPYSERALRGRYREVINNLERDTPGTRHSIVKSYDGLKPLLGEKFGPAELVRCPGCGEPTISTQCKACAMVKELGERYGVGR